MINQDHSKQAEIEPAALKITAAARYLGGISAVTVRRLIERGEIKRHPGIRHILIPKSELDRFLAQAK